MYAPKIKLRAHTYQFTTEIKIQVINKQCKDTMVQFEPGLLISSPEGLHHTYRRQESTIRPWRLTNFLNEF